MGRKWKTRVDGSPSQVGQHYQERGGSYPYGARSRGSGTDLPPQTRSVDSMKKPVRARAIYIGGKKPRSGWIFARWEWMHSGAVDFGKQAKEGKMPPYPESSRYRWEGHPQRTSADLVGLDHPRKDITSFKSKGSKKVYVGATGEKTRATLKNRTAQVLDTNFTKEEIDDMESVYVEGSRPSSRRAAATCSSVRSAKRRGPYEVPVRNHIITVQPKYADNEEILTHELVHARRYGTGEHTMDRDREEKETELETMARVKNPPKWAGGYYQYVDEKGYPMERYKKKDRIALTGHLKRNIKGKRALQRIKEYYPHSEIAKARFSPAERVDRHFFIKDADGREIEHHMRFEKKPTRNHVVEDLKADFGENIQVWEWKDGKKVRVL